MGTTPDIMSLSPTIRHHRPPTMSPSLTTQHHQPLTMSPNPIIQAHTMNPNPTTHRLLITNPNLTIPHPLTMNQNPIIPNPNLTIPLLTLDTMNQNPTIHPVQTMGHLHLAQIMAHQNRTNPKLQLCLKKDHTSQKKSNQLPSQHMKLIPDLIAAKFRTQIAIMLIQKLDVLFIIIAMLMVNKIHSIVLMAPFSMNIWELVIMPQQCFARVAKGMQDPLTLLTMPLIMPLTM